MKHILGITFAACAAFGVAQAASAQQYYGPESVAPPAPPPAVREDVVPAPVGPQQATWMPGHYEWNGRGYFWVGGHYIDQPAGLIWEPGGWVARDGRWVWMAGHWRR